MVGEFTELQALIGGKYLQVESEVRSSVLAERLELLLSILAKGERPSRSSDPYALSRVVSHWSGLLPQIRWIQRCLRRSRPKSWISG